MVIGGGQVYREALPRADRVYLTVVDGTFAGNTTFPCEALREGWTVTAQETCEVDEKTPYRHEFFRLERRAASPGSERAFDVDAVMRKGPERPT